MSYGKIRCYGTKGLIRLLVCRNCGFAFADRSYWRNPYDDSDYYDLNPLEVSHAEFSKTDVDRLQLVVEGFPKGGRLLDFGGGAGSTAAAANHLGFSSTVVEGSRKAVERGIKYHPNIEWICNTEIPSFISDNSYDVITMFHVLEHLTEPTKLLLQAHRILKSGGFLLIEVPNWGSLERHLKGMNWLYVIDHHVNYFSKRTLDKLVEPLGFERQAVQYRRTFAINETQPWKEPLKKILCLFGFGNILRCLYRKL